MTLSIKDPGSALTHFIGMILAGLAATPLLVLAAKDGGRYAVPALAIFAASMILLYGASTTYHTFNISEKVNLLNLHFLQKGRGFFDRSYKAWLGYLFPSAISFVKLSRCSNQKLSLLYKFFLKRRL